MIILSNPIDNRKSVKESELDNKRLCDNNRNYIRKLMSALSYEVERQTLHKVYENMMWDTVISVLGMLKSGV